MTSVDKKLTKLRSVITENLRTQLDTKQVSYISAGHALEDAKARQSHCIFARRGCGKTLLLHHSSRALDKNIKTIYINCEDFKHHSFPNVLIEILDSIFSEIERNLHGWFGRDKKLKELISALRVELKELCAAPDSQDFEMRDTFRNEGSNKENVAANAGVKANGIELGVSGAQEIFTKNSSDLERKYSYNENKLSRLNLRLPHFKSTVKEFFSISKRLTSVFLQVDDFYHLLRTDQPFVADYLHRLCKDTPLKFKIATLKHNTVLYIERAKQPIGIQERHDYQPINIDFNFERFDQTRDQNRGIFYEYAGMVGMSQKEFDNLFKGAGFDRLVLAGGGVPRDCLSFFLEVLDQVKRDDTNAKIGKDDVRFLSKETFERRIEELKQDSEGQDQESLLRGISVIREFCFEKKSNVFLVAEREIQSDDDLRTLLYRLLDYRIIHKVASSITHKSKEGNYQGFAIDIGCYAYMRNLKGKLNEIELSDMSAKEKMRSSPIFEGSELRRLFKSAKGIQEKLALEEIED